MKSRYEIRMLLTTAAAVMFAAGCSTDPGLTSNKHPGPVVGKAVGTGVGVVTGNAVGAVVGVGEGVAVGVAAPFDTTKRTVRRWHTETTTDGRTIQVPEDIEVDAQGRPVKAV